MFTYQDRVTAPELDSRNKIGTTVTPNQRDEETFSRLMGQPMAGVAAISKINSDLLTKSLMNQIPPFKDNGNMRFDVYFPDGIKVLVLSQNFPNRLELNIKSNSRQLTKQLNASKRKTQKDLDSYFGKQVLINVI